VILEDRFILVSITMGTIRQLPDCPYSGRKEFERLPSLPLHMRGPRALHPLSPHIKKAESNLFDSNAWRPSSSIAS